MTIGPTHSYRGEVLKVLSRSGGGAIIVLSLSAVRRIHVIVPWNLLPIQPQIGDTWRVEGRFKYNQKHGSQLHASCAFIDFPRGNEIVSFLGHSPYFPEADLRTSKSAYKKCDEGLRLMLDAADYVGVARALKLEAGDAVDFCERWLDFWSEIRLRKVLVSASFGVAFAPLLLNFWGRQAAELLTENPYRYLPFARWNQVDSAALDVFDIDAEASVRLTGAVEAAMLSAARIGDTAVDSKTLDRLLRLRLGSKSLAAKAIKLALTQRRVVAVDTTESAGVYQSAGLHRIESALYNRLSTKSTLTTDAPGRQHVRAQLRFHATGRKLHSLRVLFAEARSHADVVFQLLLANERALHLMPGQSVTSHLLDQRLRIRVRSFAEFFADGIGRIIPEVVYLYGIEGLNLPSFSKILQRLPATVDIHLVVRSKYQVAIGPGPVLQWLMSLNSMPSTTLMPSGKSPHSGLLNFLLDIDRGRTKPVSHARYRGAIRLVGASGWRETLKETVSEFYAAAALQPTLVVLPLDAQCSQFNTIIHQETVLYRMENGESATSVRLQGEEFGTSGEPIVCNTEIWELGLVGGALGTLLQIFDTPKYEIRYGHPVATLATAKFNLVGNVTLTAQNLAQMSLAHALPTQRCQFASPEHTIVPLTSAPFVDRLWLHKAVATASDAITFVGDEELLSQAALRYRRRRPRRFGALQGFVNPTCQGHSA